MADKALPTPEQLRQLLRYDPETGKLFWRVRDESWFEPKSGKTAAHLCKIWNARFASKQAFTSKNNHGYHTGAVFGVSLSAHRVIVAMKLGQWHSGDVDHENGDRSDNREKNLRCVTRRENSQNCALSKSNKTGFAGVYWSARRNQYSVTIGDGPNNRVGYFARKSDAIKARKRAEIEHGYHENHGRLRCQKQ